MAAEPLPDSLGRYFLVSTARAAGVSPGRLRAGDLARPFRGIRIAPSTAAAATAQVRASPIDALRIAHLERIGAYRAGMATHEFVVLAAAAVLWGLPLPMWLLSQDHLDIGVLSPHRAPRLAGVKGHQVAAKLVRVIRHPVHDVMVTSPASTWAMLAAVCRDLRDVVAVGDAAVREWRVDAPLASPAQLAAAVAAGRRVGVGRLREALPLLRTRSASRGETWTRMILVDAGLPEPALNHPVRDERGERIGHADLAYPAGRVAIEYEGGQHRDDPDQWARDIERYERMAAAGWIVVRLTSADVFDDSSRAVRRVSDAVHRRGR